MTRHEWRGAALVAATYGYFLIFAEFAFIELARPVAGDGAALRGVMAALGAGGVAGSLAAARLHRPGRAGRGLAAWLAACALAATAAIPAPRAGVAGLAATGAATGLALGGATVWLASSLRVLAGPRRLGLVSGLGTGAAYALCNLPSVFTAAPSVQAGLAAAGVAAAALLAWRAPADETGAEEGPAPVSLRGAASWVAVFLALVWMDSAAFYIIQHTGALKAATWAGGETLLANAFVHFVAAALAGLMLDGGRPEAVALLAGLALAAACRWILNTGAGFAYVAGVSFYSAALVCVPARLGRPGVAAAVFALAGWTGSALGIGMAQDLHGVPGWFGPAALALVAAGLALRRFGGGAALALALALAAAAGSPRAEAAGEEAAVARGREVYVAEGCIHCHSQYVRPGTEDVVRWGPARPLEELLAERPPLPGNRRQGPDLLNVGNRRTREWNRLHLIAPREVSPGSRMPSYARLFAPGEARGEDLLAYLASRGAGTEEHRAAMIAAWEPDRAARAAGGEAEAAACFARLCAQCHGADGRGGGPVAARLAGRPADLTRAGMDRDPGRLARLIKFGRPGTAMAGHESLGDAEVVSLARHVAALQSARSEEMKILVVEDERKVAGFVAQALQEQAYVARAAGSCAAARRELAESSFDAVVLDLSLPDGDGLGLLAEWRAAGFNEPVLILSARDAVEDRIKGLNLGADDYLPKPFSVDELVARVRSLLRRQAGAKSTVLIHRGLRLDLLARELRIEGRPVELTSREFALAELFLQNAGRVLTRTLIGEKVWEASYDLETNLIDVYVRRLRAKLERPGQPPLIRTVRGTGYQLA